MSDDYNNLPVTFGEPGPKGDQGPQGEQGPPGPPGGGAALPTGPTCLGSVAGVATALTASPAADNFTFPLHTTSGVGSSPPFPANCFVTNLGGEAYPIGFGDVNCNSGVARIDKISGDATTTNVALTFNRYNWPTNDAALTASPGDTGLRRAVTFAAAAGADAVTYQWPKTSCIIFDVLCTFTIGTSVKTTSKRYKCVKTTAGTLTVTAVGTPVSDGDTIATVDVALSVTSNNLTLTITPNAAATNAVCELSGQLTKLVA